MARGRQIKLNSLTSTELTTEELASKFFQKNKTKNLAPETQSTYFYIISDFVSMLGGSTPARRISPVVIEEYTKIKTEEGLKPATVNSKLKHLRSFINYGISLGAIEKFVIEFPKVEETVKEPYSQEEQRKLLRKPLTNNWVEWRTWAMINYFLGTGQRLSTALNVKVADINFQEKKVFLAHNKDKRQKYMPLPSALIPVLKEYIELSELDIDDYLFPEYEAGKQLTRRGAEDAIAKYNRKRGVEKTSIHLFRHTFAKEYIIAGGNPAKLQKLLNHKTIEQTMKYVNLYSNEYADELDLYNPLHTVSRSNKDIIRKRVG